MWLSVYGETFSCHFKRRKKWTLCVSMRMWGLRTESEEDRLYFKNKNLPFSRQSCHHNGRRTVPSSFTCKRRQLPSLPCFSPSSFQSPLSTLLPQPWQEADGWEWGAGGQHEGPWLLLSSSTCTVLCLKVGKRPGQQCEKPGWKKENTGSRLHRCVQENSQFFRANVWENW